MPRPPSGPSHARPRGYTRFPRGAGQKAHWQTGAHIPTATAPATNRGDSAKPNRSGSRKLFSEHFKISEKHLRLYGDYIGEKGAFAF